MAKMSTIRVHLSVTKQKSGKHSSTRSNQVMLQSGNPYRSRGFSRGWRSGNFEFRIEQWREEQWHIELVNKRPTLQVIQK